MVRLDRSIGEVQFAPAVREPDGSLRGYGAVPPKGAPLRVPSYRTGEVWREYPAATLEQVVDAVGEGRTVSTSNDRYRTGPGEP